MRRMRLGDGIGVLLATGLLAATAGIVNTVVDLFKDSTLVTSSACRTCPAR